jgi:hypothetical protein
MSHDFLTFNFFSQEPMIGVTAPNPESLPVGSFAYYKGEWAHVVIVPPKKPRNNLDAGHKVWSLLPEHQVPYEIRLKTLLLT